MEDRGLKINRKTTVYLRFNVDGNLDGDINLHGQNLERVNLLIHLKYTFFDTNVGPRPNLASMCG